MNEGFNPENEKEDLSEAELALIEEAMERYRNDRDENVLVNFLRDHPDFSSEVAMQIADMYSGQTTAVALMLGILLEKALRS